MKYLIMAFFIIWSATVSGGKAPDRRLYVLLRTYDRYASPKAEAAIDVIPEILKAADKHGVSATLLVSILLVESRGIKSAINKRSKDHGIMQINHRTAQHLKISKNCVYDIKCSINEAAKYIKTMQTRKNYRACMYNVGPNGLKRDRMKVCLRYEKKLASIKLQGGLYE